MGPLERHRTNAIGDFDIQGSRGDISRASGILAIRTPMPPLSYRSPKAEVRPSSIHGNGLFAAQPIRVGEIVAVKGGYVFEASAWEAIEPALGSAEIQLSEDLFIAPARSDEREGSMIYTNHSCDPNIAVQGQIVFVAMRDIDAGEELTHDWATRPSIPNSNDLSS